MRPNIKKSHNFMSGEIQSVPQQALEKKLGRKLSKGDTFITKVGTWKVIDMYRYDKETYTVEKIADGNNDEAPTQT